MNSPDLLNLVLTPTRPVLHNGASGQYVPQGAPTTQYSMGFLETLGTIRIDGEDFPVTGQGWYDRQWNHSPRDNPLAFTWFGLCLDNGDTLSVFDCSGSGHGDRKWATIARPDGTHIVAAVQPEAFGERKTPSGRLTPRRWTLDIPAMKAQLDLNQKPLADGRSIYTGAIDIQGRYEGEAVKGYGFCDIVGTLAS